MSTDIHLSTKVTEVKHEMQEYRSLPEYLLDGVGAALTYFRRSGEKRKSFLPSNPLGRTENRLPTYWLSGLVIAGLTMFVGWLTSLLINEPMTQRDLTISAWVAAAGALALIANKVNIRSFLETFHDSILDKILVPEDVDELGDWMEENFKLFWPMVAGLVGGPILAYILLRNLRLTSSDPFGVGTIVVVVLASVQSIWVAYYLFPFYVSFPSRLARYHFDLYTTDPSSSEVVGRLSRLMTFIMYVTLAYIVQLTIGLNRLEVLNLSTAFVFTGLVWAPTVILYAAGQYHISNVITRAKWKTLNDIQAKIESLYSEALAGKNQLPEKDTLDVIQKLMDSHDRIKATPNSALNFRAGLNFLNSLLLPVLAFVVANLREVITFIEGRLGN